MFRNGADGRISSLAVRYIKTKTFAQQYAGLDAHFLVIDLTPASISGPTSLRPPLRAVNTLLVSRSTYQTSTCSRAGIYLLIRCKYPPTIVPISLHRLLPVLPSVQSTSSQPSKRPLS